MFHETPDGHEEVNEEAVMRSLSNQEVEGDILFDVVVNPSLFDRPGHLLNQKPHLIDLLRVRVLYR